MESLALVETDLEASTVVPPLQTLVSLLLALCLKVRGKETEWSGCSRSTTKFRAQIALLLWRKR